MLGLSDIGRQNSGIGKNRERDEAVKNWNRACICTLCRDRIIGDPQLRRALAMQRQFTIELRVDYSDQEKNEAMRKALQQAARHVYATATLLADGVKPQIAIFSDDFFTGHETIALLEDTIAKGLAQINEQPGDEDSVSSELMAAATAKS